MGNQVVFGNPSPNELNVGIWRYDIPDRLDSNSANYELSSVAKSLSDPFASSSRLYLSSANSATYSAAVNSSAPDAPAPRRFALWVAVIAGLCVFGLRRKGIINRLANKLLH